MTSLTSAIDARLRSCDKDYIGDLKKDPFVPSRKARQYFARIIDGVQHNNERPVITEHSRPVAVVISVDDMKLLDQAIKIIAEFRDRQINKNVEDAEVLNLEESKKALINAHKSLSLEKEENYDVELKTSNSS